MSVVVDANALVVLGLDSRRAPAVEERLRAWRNEGESLHAPDLVRYEIASALTRAVAAGTLPASQVGQAWALIAAIPLTLHRLENGPEVVALAQRLQRTSAYDAAYVALAEGLGGELWTLDGALARNASSRGLPVRLIETT